MQLQEEVEIDQFLGVHSFTALGAKAGKNGNSSGFWV